MNLSPIYQQRCEEILEEGRQLERQLGIESATEYVRQQGSLLGQRIVLENILKVPFGTLDEELLAVIETLLKLQPEEYAPLIMQLSDMSREELLQRFGTTEN